MRILLYLSSLIILFLIKIGDGVLLIINLLLKFILRVLKTILKSFKIFFLVSSFISFLIKTPLSLLKRGIKIFAFPKTGISFRKSVDRENLVQNINPIRKKIRPTAFFPLPFRIKLKYFTHGMVFSLVFIFLPFSSYLFIQTLPKPQELTVRQIPQTTKIYDRNKILLFQFYANQNRTLVPLSEIPQSLKNATIAIEDKDFYRHPGFDITAIIRSAYGDFQGKGLQGGSTITQQLIKSALLSSEKTIQRKIKEIILAFWTERIYSKDQILEMYFNQIPYGGTAWGAEAASETYFGKNVKDLNLAESAFLAGIPKAPTTYSPFGQSDFLWKKRQKDVLNRMALLGYISRRQADEAYDEKLNFRKNEIPIYAPHFVMYVKDLLVKKYGLPMVEKGGLNVVTTLDLKLQDKIQNIVAREVESNSYLNLTNGAALIVSPKNGDILAMVGSNSYSNPNGGNVNLTTSLRQPGSSIKLVTYAAALSHGFTAATIIDDSPVTFNIAGSTPYSPVNYDGKFHGRIPLRLALGNSLNIPAVKTLNQIGIANMISLGKEMGITSWEDSKNYGLSITLGAAETKMIDMAQIYGTVANGGAKAEINPIIKATDYQGNILEEKKITGNQVLDEGVAFILSDILADNNARAWEFGTNSPLYIPGHYASVKTGTSDNKRDNWTIGYTPDYVAAVWVGNNDNSPMSQSLASGITGAAPIWNKIMTTLLQGKTDPKPRIPGDVIQKNCLGKKEYFIKGTENSVSCVPLPTWTPTPTK